jgi:hypothetical protein
MNVFKPASLSCTVPPRLSCFCGWNMTCSGQTRIGFKATGRRVVGRLFISRKDVEGMGRDSRVCRVGIVVVILLNRVLGPNGLDHFLTPEIRLCFSENDESRTHRKEQVGPELFDNAFRFGVGIPRISGIGTV